MADHAGQHGREEQETGCPSTDFYELLGVPSDASARDIERAWRQKALLHHPDKAPEEEKVAAEARFKEIAQAHEVLADPEKRQAYDAYGPSLRPSFSTPGFGGEGGFGFEDGDEADMLFQALFEALNARKPTPQRTSSDVMEGVQGLALVAGVCIAWWICSPFLNRCSNWLMWQARFLLHDLRSWSVRRLQ